MTLSKEPSNDSRSCLQLCLESSDDFTSIFQENQRLSILWIFSFFLQIVDIPKKTFPKLYELHIIDFSYNNISSIDRSVFVNLLSLRQLNFTHNHLTQIESSTFGAIPTLLSIDLSHNRLEKVKRGAFGGLASLRSINLEHNQLGEIPTPSISMTQMHLANNNISRIIGRSPWPVMNSLIYLDLNNNQFGDSLDGGKNKVSAVVCAS